MNKPVIALGATAVALAAAAVFLLFQIDTERERATRAREVSVAAQPRASVSHIAARDAAADPVAPARADARRDDTRIAVELHADAQRRRATEYLRRLDDPAEQRANRERAFDTARHLLAGLDRRLGLTPEQFERLVQLLADQELDKRVAAARCIVDPACVAPVLDPALSASRGKAVHDIIGDKGLRELRASRATQVERGIVDGLQARLANDTPLTAMQADDLTRTLFAEGRRQDLEMQQRQQTTVMFGLREGAVLRYADDSPTAELALQSGEASMQAMRDRAATMLGGEQLAVFNRMYDDLLIGFRRHIRGKYAGERT